MRRTWGESARCCREQSFDVTFYTGTYRRSFGEVCSVPSVFHRRPGLGLGTKCRLRRPTSSPVVWPLCWRPCKGRRARLVWHKGIASALGNGIKQRVIGIMGSFSKAYYSLLWKRGAPTGEREYGCGYTKKKSREEAVLTRLRWLIV